MIRKLDNIKITISFEQVIERLKIEEPEDIEIVAGLFEKAREIAKPKVLYREAFVEEISGRNVKINGCDFESSVLAATLKDIHRVFAYICTCGTEVDEWSHSEQDYILSLWLDMIKELFLFDAHNFFIAHLKQAYQFEKLSTVNPGSGDLENWPISQQVQLFGMIGNVKSEIGVELNDSFLMTPIKSTSGLIFSSAAEFSNCALCTRENCVGRKVEFDSALYAKTFG